jgi:ATP-dependent DNA helicase RecG
VIHYLLSRASVDAATIAPVLQKTIDEAADSLRRLSDDRFDVIEPVRKERRLGTLLPYHRNDQDEVDRRIVAHVREYATISNQTVQNLFQVGVQRASVILRTLTEREILRKTGDSPERGPSVRYERGPRFPADRKGGRAGPERLNEQLSLWSDRRGRRRPE